jgi:aryl-alcohol dehydrogenase-like predicted oxidoreductase
MKYRMLGRTKLKVSEIGFGCGNIGGLMIRGSHEEQLEAVKLALDLGINLFDTAPSYGNGKSETNLGPVLAELEPEIILGTKVRLSMDDLDDIIGAVERSVGESLSRLQRDRVDILQIHSRIAMTRDSSEWSGALGLQDVLGENGVADAFDSICGQGLARFIGLTGLGETAALHKVVESNRFDVIQAYFNLLNPSAGRKVPLGFRGHDFKQLINKSVERGMGVVAIRVMAAGAVGGEISRKGYAAPVVRGPLVLGGEYHKDEARAQNLDFLIHGDMRSIPLAALKFVLMHKGVSAALVGFSNRSQILEAVQTTELNPITQTNMERLRETWE